MTTENAVINVGIAGYGNLGRGVETAMALNPDIRLAAVYTRREPNSVQTLNSDTLVKSWTDLTRGAEDLDVVILCGGSKEDLPVQGPEIAALYTTVDSFDTHAKIPDYFDRVDSAARNAGTTAVISTGWDPGLFSIARLYGEAVLPAGETYTFWGRGLSQGHSDAVRRVPGVANGVQYTIPSESALEAVRAGERPSFTTREKHRRECWVVLDDSADAAAVEEAIVTMPDYFADYDTTVNFISAEELAANHSVMPHGGRVFRSGNTSDSHRDVVEFGLTLDNNPEFTASVLVAYARAAHRLAQSQQFGAKTVFDIPPGLLSPRSAADLRADLL